MKIYNRFKNIFDIFISKEESNKLLDLLHLMYTKKILNDELTLNLIKALVLILYMNKDNYSVYYQLLNYITFDMNKKIRKNILTQLECLDLSIQLNLNEKCIDKIIINTNILFLNSQQIDIQKLLELWIEVINTTNLIKSSVPFKIGLYIHFIKKLNNIITEKKTINVGVHMGFVSYMKNITNIINNFI
jgi:hypothetical protein